MNSINRRDALKKYRRQQYCAAQRGIAWQISFEDWLHLWAKSGRWAQRGCGRGTYVMARCADCGPYSLTNCFICSFEQNVREGRILLVEKLGKGSKDARGWTYIAGRKSPYQVVYGRRYIGVFKTQSEAELAYAAACLEHGVIRKIAEQPLSVFFAPQGYSTGFKNHEPA